MDPGLRRGDEVIGPNAPISLRSMLRQGPFHSQDDRGADDGCCCDCARRQTQQLVIPAKAGIHSGERASEPTDPFRCLRDDDRKGFPNLTF